MNYSDEYTNDLSTDKTDDILFRNTNLMEEYGWIR